MDSQGDKISFIGLPCAELIGHAVLQATLIGDLHISICVYVLYMLYICMYIWYICIIESYICVCLYIVYLLYSKKKGFTIDVTYIRDER